MLRNHNHHLKSHTALWINSNINTLLIQSLLTSFVL